MAESPYSDGAGTLVDSQPLFNSATLPIGSYTTKIDSNGRIKLPAPVNRFLNQFPEERVFITELGEGFLRFFPVSIWIHNLRVMQRNPDLARQAEALNRVASNGEVADIDSQGRVVIPQRLRQYMQWEEGELRMCGALGGSIEVHREEDYQAAHASSREDARGALDSLLQRGFQL